MTEYLSLIEMWQPDAWVHCWQLVVLGIQRALALVLNAEITEHVQMMSLMKEACGEGI